MAGLILRWLISASGLDALKGEASQIAQRMSRRALLRAIVSVAWLTAFGFALAGLTVWLTEQLGAVAACGIVALILGLVGLAFELTLRRSKTSPLPSRRDEPVLAKPAMLDGSSNIQSAGLAATLVVAMAGYILARQTFRR